MEDDIFFITLRVLLLYPGVASSWKMMSEAPLLLPGCRMSELRNHLRRDVVGTMQRIIGFELSKVPSCRDRHVVPFFFSHTASSLFPGPLSEDLKKNGSGKPGWSWFEQ